jgi:hypothetical protein
MGRTGWESAAVGILISVAWTAPARAQNVAPTPAAAHASLPAVPQLRLSWPVAPLQFSFSEVEVTGYANGPLQLFRAESLWLKVPGLRLLTAASAERALELDCRLTCQPIVKHSFDFEARLPLPTLSARVPDTYAFLRSSTFYTSQSSRSSRLLTTGIAGSLNF